MAADDNSINDAPTMRPAPAPGVGRRFVAGDMILGRYAVTRELGEGGMGVVYQCLDTVGGVEVAVKGLPPDVSRNEDEMDDIRANYQIVRRLRHPNIAGVATLEMDSATGDYYLVMDLAAGTTLKRWARRHADAGIDAKLAILRQVAAALDYAHAEKVIHRDVKPENVMVDDEGVVKVLDFGLAAQIRSSQSRTSAAVTSRGGTPGYKSPEQWRGKPQREPADVYSFGVMAYWMFAGVLPFDGDDPVVLGHAVLTEPVEQIAGLPEHINAALVKALAKKPEDRFASCGEVVDALEGKNVHVKRVDGVDRAGSPSAPMVRLRVPRARVGVPPLQSGDNSDRKDRKGGVGKVLAVFALLAALAGGGYYGWTKYGEGVKAREAEERARRAKAAEERIARIKAENEKAEAEKRRVEAEREKRQEEAKRKIAAEREKDRKIRDLSAVEDEIEDCKGRINGILKGNFKANGSLKGDWLGFDASKITMIDATVSVREEVPWKRIAKDLTVEDSVVTIENAIVAAQKESKRLKERLENITRIKGIYDAKELESRKEQCRSCGGSKRVACMRCKGDGRVKVPGDDCSACDGRGVISKPRQCDACGGSGNASVKRRCSSCQGKKVRCSSCRGRGFYDITGSLRRPRCGACNGRGYYLCNSCGGRGTEVETVSCKKCSGLGTLDITMRCSRCAGAGKEQREQTCPSCDGTGKSTCESCGGRGFIYRPKGEAESQIRKKEGIRTSSQLQSSVQPVAVGSVIVTNEIVRDVTNGGRQGTALAHRWSFSGDLKDSVGGRHGKAVDGMVTFENGQVRIRPGGGYVDLGANVLPGGGVAEYTFEIWATKHSIQNWARVYQIPDNWGRNDFYWAWNNGTEHRKWKWKVPGYGNWTKTIGNGTGEGIENHFVFVYGHDEEKKPCFWVYILRGENVYWWRTERLEGTMFKSHSAFWLGHGDGARADASYNEVRIWNRALTRDEIIRSGKLGPDRLP